MSDRREKCPQAKMFWSVSTKNEDVHTINTCKGYF